MIITDDKLREAAEEAARIIFHGMHPGGVGRRDEPPECRGFKEETARIIQREAQERQGTDCYIAICCDRHIDEVVRVFSAPEDAIEYAKAFVEKNAFSPEDVEEKNIEGWLYYARYSCEGDHVRVEKSELL